MTTNHLCACGPNRVFLFTEDYVKDEVLQDLDPNIVFVFAQEGGKTVFTNRLRGQ